MVNDRLQSGNAKSPVRQTDTTELLPKRKLQRGLGNRHIQMIALGGAIGTGLFYGSADSISVSGPAVLVAYLVGGLAIFMVIRALGEMSVAVPVSGAFSYYAYKHWSARAGFISGWNYWFNYVAVAMVELAVVGNFVNYWFPGVPRWVSATFFLITITVVNLIGVKTFGEFEFWFALIKIVAVAGMIILGLVVIIFGINNNPELPTPSFANLVNDGGFFPHGMWGMMLSLVVVMFSFGGVELIGITAGEAKNPQSTIPKAINQIIWRILIFYVGALAIIMAVIPWSRIDGQMSPFVQIFDNIGIQGAANILNLVVLTAVMSVYNSALYSNGRMLYSLSLQGNAPRFLRRLSSNGVPVAGVLTSSVVTAFAVVVVLVWPDFAFSYLLAIATIAAIINWSMIMITEYKFRKELGKEAAKLSFKLPGGTFTTAWVLVFLGMVLVLMFFHPSYRTALLVGPIWLGFLLTIYQIKVWRQTKRCE